MNEPGNLLPTQQAIEYGIKQPQEEHRLTVVAVVYDPKTTKYLCQYWPEYDELTCLLSGGVEGNEQPIEALHREISEETGYQDYKVLGELGGKILTHYTKHTTDQHFVKEIIPYLVVLQSTKAASTQKEEDEKFSNLFKSKDETMQMMQIYEDRTGSTLADHKDILTRADNYLKKLTNNG